MFDYNNCGTGDSGDLNIVSIPNKKIQINSVLYPIDDTNIRCTGGQVLQYSARRLGCCATSLESRANQPQSQWPVQFNPDYPKFTTRRRIKCVNPPSGRRRPTVVKSQISYRPLLLVIPCRIPSYSAADLVANFDI